MNCRMKLNRTPVVALVKIQFAWCRTASAVLCTLVSSTSCAIGASRTNTCRYESAVPEPV